MTTPHTRTRRHDAPPPPPRSSGGGLDLLTLVIASASAVVAALVVSHFWGAGTIAATAATPVIVALVREGLARPAQRITEVSARAPTAASRVLGARSEAAGPTIVAEEDGAGDPQAGEDRVYRGAGRSRRAWKVALLTGLVAFVVAALAITLPELVAGKAILGGSSHKTTLFRGSRHKSATTTTKTP